MEPLAEASRGPAVAVVIPTLDEAQSIKAVVTEIPRALAQEIIVVDGGSTDGTPAIAAAAGARVIAVGGRGYGRACAAGVAAASPQARIIVFIDGDGADRGDLMALLVDPIRRAGSAIALAANGHDAGTSRGGDRRRAVFAAAVDNDDFLRQIARDLGDDGFDRLRFVERRDDDGDGRTTAALG